MVENAFKQPQSVIVLGGSSDIARAIVRRLVDQRVRTVVVAGRNAELLDEAATEARAGGATSTPTVIFDAADPYGAGDAVARCFDAAAAPVDLVIVAVGLLGDQLADEVDPRAAARSASVNFAWPVAALTEVRNRLVAQGSGRILVMSSVAAIRVRRSSYLYGGAKAGLDRLCEGLADSLSGTGVTLQILRPGQVRTKMTAGLADQPFTVGVEDVAEATMAALTTNKRVITVPSVLRIVFAVLRHLPAPIWRRLVADR